MIEEWKNIIGYEGLYQISSLGNIKALTREIHTTRNDYTYIRIIPEHMMSLVSTDDGYLRVTLTKEGKRKSYLVHRLVAEHFIPKVEGKSHINHLDENKTNNKVSNLEWCTIWENSIYGNRCKKIGDKSSKTPHTWLYKSVLQYSLDGTFIREFKSIKQAANAVGAKSTSGIQSCCAGRLKSSMGFIWKYINNK